MPGMPNGGQTGDPCVLLTFPRTGLAGEGSVGSRIDNTSPLPVIFVPLTDCFIVA